MDKKEIIEKLKALQALTEDLVKYGSYYESGCTEMAAEKISQIQSDLGSLPGIPSVVNAMPVFPEGEAEYNTAKTETAKSKSYSTLALAATAGLAILMFCVPKPLPVFLTGVAGVVWYFVYQTHKLNKQGLVKKEKAYQESLERHRASMGEFRHALVNYPKEVKDGIEAAKTFGQRYREKRSEIFAVTEQYQELKEAALNHCTELITQINEHDYISEEYYHHVPKLITLLQSGRADSYKEALNIAIEEERQNAIEAARREEEARRLEVLERQAEEERRHNMMIERQEAAHQRQMAQAERDRAEAERLRAVQARRDQERATRDAAHANAVARNNALHRCAKCAKSDACGINRGIPNCGAFEPKAIYKK